MKISQQDLYRYTVKEDILNSISHGLGVLFALIGMAYLSYLSDNVEELIVSIIYSLTLMFMFLSSTLYHAIFHDVTRGVLKRLDHSAIYILITGTYLPFTFLVINNMRAYIIFTILVILTIFGILLKVFYVGKFKKISTIVYILMGWMVIFQLKDLLMDSTVNVLLYLLLGGIAYTVGAIFYAFSNFKYHHFIWHLFVLVAAIFQYIAVVNIIK